MILAAGKNNRAFTLFELMLVLVLLGLSAMVVLPSIDKGIKNREARQAALGFAAVARELGNRARSEGVPQRLVVDKARNSYLVARNHEIALPANLSFAGVQGGEILEHGLHRFSFFPNGASFGGRVDFAAGKGIEYSVRFHALTGRVEVLRGGDG
ncbi:MAG: prepilin-type N-terminal cleavage/methylation domain-containing protein [Candidatus Binatia bacterium]